MLVAAVNVLSGKKRERPNQLTLLACAVTVTVIVDPGGEDAITDGDIVKSRETPAFDIIS
jgi:hypothetical protein